MARVLDSVSVSGYLAKTSSVKYHCELLTISAFMMFRLVMVGRIVFLPSGSLQRRG